MNRNNLLVTAGSVMMSNGLLLAADPPRFSVWRKSGWMPDRVQGFIGEAERHPARGRTLGLALLGLGAVLLTWGFVHIPRGEGGRAPLPRPLAAAFNR